MKPPRKRFILILTGMGAAVFILILGVMLALRGGDSRAKRGPDDLAELFKPRAIPPEELFLLEEPDFVPPVILERERREAWSVEDAAPFWMDPLDEGTALYADMIDTTMNNLMERVP